METIVNEETISYGLTQRERIVLSFLSNGLSNKDIAEMLKISVQTIKNHISLMMRKTGSKNRAHLAYRFAKGEI